MQENRETRLRSRETRVKESILLGIKAKRPALKSLSNKLNKEITHFLKPPYCLLDISDLQYKENRETYRMCLDSGWTYDIQNRLRKIKNVCKLHRFCGYSLLA